ncbi:sulfotransferase [Microbulbifer halophilus]
MTGLGFLSRQGPGSLGLKLYELGRFDDICAIVDHYDCLCDLPYPLLYERLAERYPDSRFVLTTRRSEDQWLQSLRKLNLRNGPTEAFRIAYGCYDVDGNENRLRDFYLRHNEAAREFFRDSGRFAEVCWEQGDGLNELGELLGVNISGASVPVANASADKDSRKILERHCRKGRLGAAVRYARSVEGTDELLALVNRRLDRELGRFLAVARPKAALRRLRLRGRQLR